MTDRPTDRHDLRGAMEHDFKWLARREIKALHMTAEEADDMAARVADVVLAKAGRASREQVLERFQAQTRVEREAMRKLDGQVEEIRTRGPEAISAHTDTATPTSREEALLARLAELKISTISLIQWPDDEDEVETRAWFAEAAGTTPGLMGWELYALRSFTGYLVARAAYGEEALRVLVNHERGVLDEIRGRANLETLTEATRKFIFGRRGAFLDVFLARHGGPPERGQAIAHDTAAAVVASFLQLTKCRRDTEAIIRAYDVFQDSWVAQRVILEMELP